MLRLLPIVGIVAMSLGLTGCAADWDTITSHRFREGLLDHPWATTKGLWIAEDPMLVLRTDPPRDGDERASAMHRLKEPILNNGTQEDQDIIINVLARAATTDPSPVLRMEAIGALGRFQDPRVVGILIAAYQNAHGRRAFDPPPKIPTQPALPAAALSAGRAPTSMTRSGHTVDVSRQPTGFLPEWVCAIRCRAAEALGDTGRPDAAQFLAAIAGGAGSDVAPEGSDDRDVILAAIRGLGKCRQPDSVKVLAHVLAQRMSVSPNLRDTAIIGRTHEGLVRLTGLKIPPDPEAWNQVVQADIKIAPEPGWWERTKEEIVSLTK